VRKECLAPEAYINNLCHHHTVLRYLSLNTRNPRGNITLEEMLIQPTFCFRKNLIADCADNAGFPSATFIFSPSALNCKRTSFYKNTLQTDLGFLQLCTNERMVLDDDNNDSSSDVHCPYHRLCLQDSVYFHPSTPLRVKTRHLIHCHGTRLQNNPLRNSGLTRDR